MPIPDFLVGPLLGLFGASLGVIVALYYRGNYFKVNGELKVSEVRREVTKNNMEAASVENAAHIQKLKNELERKDRVLQDTRKDYEELLTIIKESGNNADIADERWRKLSEGGS